MKYLESKNKTIFAVLINVVLCLIISLKITAPLVQPLLTDCVDKPPMEAAYNLNMNGISYEIDDEYFSKGQKRINEIRAQQKLF